MRSRDITDAQFLHSLSTLILAKPPPNIKFLRLEVRIEARYVSFSNKVYVLKQLGWSTFGQSVKGWTTLEHIEIMIRVGIHGQDEAECGIAEVREGSCAGWVWSRISRRVSRLFELAWAYLPEASLDGTTPRKLILSSC